MVTVTSAVPVVPSTVKSIPMMPAPAPIPTLVVAMSPPPPPAVLAVAIIPIIANGLHKAGGLWNMGNAGTQRRGTCRHACERQCQRGRCACYENMRLHMPLLFMSSVVMSAHDRDNQTSTEPRVNRSFTSSSCARPLEDVRGRASSNCASEFVRRSSHPLLRDEAARTKQRASLTTPKASPQLSSPGAAPLRAMFRFDHFAAEPCEELSSVGSRLRNAFGPRPGPVRDEPIARK